MQMLSVKRSKWLA